MSNVIKGNRVLYDRNPMQLKSSVPAHAETKTVGQSGSLDVGRLLSQNALESAEISIKSAIKEVEAIKQRGKVESHFAHLNGVNEGVAKGSTDGEIKGREDGILSADKNFNDCVNNFFETVKSSDSEETARAEKIRTDCISFAFSLAGSILGMDIDSDDPKYQSLLQKFLQCSPEYVTVEADGKTFQIETLRAEALISAAGDLQGVLAYKSPLPEKACEDEVPENNQTQETEPVAADSLVSEPQICEPIVTAELQPQIDEVVDDGMTDEAQEIPIAETHQAESEPTKEKITVKSFEYKNFSDEDSSQQAEETTDDEPVEASEKFVFIKPANKKTILADEKDSMTLADVAELDKDSLKNILKNLEPGRIAAALQNQTDTVVNAITSVLSRKNQEKIIEALRYLGPVPEEEAESAASQLIAMAAKATL